MRAEADRGARSSSRGRGRAAARRAARWLSGHVLPLLVAALASVVPHAAALALEAPNVVPISAMLVTSGQPTRQSLERLAAEGFEVVIYLAPPTVADAIADEPAIVERQGLQFINFPIPFNAPTEAHFEALSAALVRAEGRRVLVHCQINMRASTLVFLHRVVVRGEPPAAAYEAVARVWSPSVQWKSLLTRVLARHRIDFEPY